MKGRRKNNYHIGIVILIFTIVVSSCKKDKSTEQIPNVPVNFTIHLNLPEYSNLNSIGNNVIIENQGYRGIIIYRRSLEEFVAYDMACPYDAAVNQGRLTVDTSGVLIYDSQCNSKFSLYDGSKVSGPSTRPMKPYNCDYVANDNTVYIYN